jgi:VanZ family protein
LGHVIAYFWLMIWFAQLYRSIAARLWLAIGFLSMGVALEYLQGTMGYRHFDYMDMLRNFSGLALGFLLALTPLQNAMRTFESWAMSRRRPA